MSIRPTGASLSGTYPAKAGAETISGAWSFTTPPTGVAASLDADLTTIAALDSTTAGALVTDGAGWIRKSYAQLKTALGLGSVDNTADSAKPVSTAQQTALDLKANLASPILSGTPTAPTPALNDASTAVATTAYVDRIAVVSPFERLAAGQASVPRMLVTNAAVATTSGTVRLIYFTATRSETVNSIRLAAGGTASVTPTLVRMGLYTEDASTGALTLVAATANDTTVLSTANTYYTRALTSPYGVVKGTRYALAILVVAGTAPTVYGAVNRPATMGAEDNASPRIVGSKAGETDLPASISAVAQSVSVPYLAVIP